MSALPETAASVRTRVVSWNDAAETKLAGLQRRLGDAKQHRNGFRRLLAVANESIVELVEIELVDLLVLEHAAVARDGDLDLLQHLANDHLDVLVVNQHALQAVDFLDLVDEVLGQFLDALDRQDVVRCGIAVEDVFPALDGVAFLQMERLALRDQVFDRLGCSVLGSMMIRRLFL